MRLITSAALILISLPALASPAPAENSEPESDYPEVIAYQDCADNVGLPLAKKGEEMLTIWRTIEKRCAKEIEGSRQYEEENSVVVRRLRWRFTDWGAGTKHKHFAAPDINKKGAH